jgi:hypothetical protein
MLTLGFASSIGYRMRMNPSLDRLQQLLARVTVLDGQIAAARLKGDAARVNELVRLRESLFMYAGDRFAGTIDDPATWKGAFSTTTRTRAGIARAAARAATAEQRRTAADAVASTVADIESRSARRPPPLLDAGLSMSGIASMVLAAFGPVAVSLSAALRAPVTFRLIGATLVSADGKHVSRTRAALRSAIAWSPVLIAAAAAAFTRRMLGPGLVRSGVVGLIAIVVMAIGLIVATFRPRSSFQDYVGNAGRAFVTRKAQLAAG